MIRTGDTAQPFSLPQRPGEVVDLADHIGSTPVVLLFFPLAFSPVCTEEFYALHRAEVLEEPVEPAVRVVRVAVARVEIAWVYFVGVM